MKRLKRSIFIALALIGFIGTDCEAIDIQKASLSEIKQALIKQDEEQLLNTQVEIVNQNQPNFSEEDFSLENGNWQIFSDLDRLNREA
ncbi:hypothetical protein IGJ01_000941 [Enterococcus sp. AZ089]|uniref:hypothetical protein n=1 Tax=unclassified Enterococcus TaxID=2608891 RepID=UPI003D2FC4BB